MTVVEIVVLVVLVLGGAVFVTLYLSNNTKIKKEKIKKEQEKVALENTKKTEEKNPVKKIVEENSIEVENYIKETLLQDELKNSKVNVAFAEVETKEILESDNLVEDAAIVLGKKKQEVHKLDEDEEIESPFTLPANLINELDNAEISEIIKANNSFEIENFDEDDNIIKEEISQLSKEGKIVLMSNLLDKKEE